MQLRVFVVFAIAQVLPLYSASNYYDILGVSKQADIKEISRSYRNLAKKFHPDKNPGNKDAEVKYRDISMAYEVLKDAKKRKIYDTYGEEGLKRENERRDYGGGGFMGGAFESFFGSFSSGGFFGDGSSSFGFGSMFGDEVEEPEAPKGESLRVPLFVTKEELQSSTVIKALRVFFTKKEAPGTRKCRCRMEMQTKQTGPGSFEMTQRQVCDQCPQYRYVLNTATIDLELDPRDGIGREVGHFPGLGESVEDAESGDLFFILSNIS